MSYLRAQSRQLCGIAILDLLVAIPHVAIWATKGSYACAFVAMGLFAGAAYTWLDAVRLRKQALACEEFNRAWERHERERASNTFRVPPFTPIGDIRKFRVRDSGPL
jgi:hypothetical protein